MVFSYIAEKYSNIPIIMVQIDAAKEWGVPSFVDEVYFHKDYKEGDCKWGGFDNHGRPCSNTKVWSKLHNDIGIHKVFSLGGGEITKKEIALARKLGIVVRQFKVTPKY